MGAAYNQTPAILQENPAGRYVLDLVVDGEILCPPPLPAGCAGKAPLIYHRYSWVCEGNTLHTGERHAPIALGRRAWEQLQLADGDVILGGLTRVGSAWELAASELS